MKRIRKAAAAGILGLGSTLFQGCPISELTSGFLSDCFDEDSISRGEYEDLNDFEQLLYEENDCGRFDPRSDVFDPFL